jgi:hypothetical protein
MNTGMLLLQVSVQVVTFEAKTLAAAISSTKQPIMNSHRTVNLQFEVSVDSCRYIARTVPSLGNNASNGYT